MKHICIVYNPSAGGDDGSKQAILDAFDGAMMRLCFVKLTDSMPEHVQKAKLEGASILVAAGGDGTVNVVAEQAVRLDMALAVLPVGTLNHFARDIGIPLDLQEAVDVIAKSGEQQKFDYCTVNEKIFVNNSSIGVYPISLKKRERLQTRLGKWPAAVIATVRTAIRLSATRLECEIEGKRYIYKTPLLFIGNNSYNFEQFGISNRVSLQKGMQYVYIVRANRITSIIRMTFRLIFGLRTKSHDFICETNNDVVIHSRKKWLNVSLDGEVMSLKTPLQYRMHSKGLVVYVPDRAS